jgi:hypothetical protein
LPAPQMQRDRDRAQSIHNRSISHVSTSHTKETSSEGPDVNATTQKKNENNKTVKRSSRGSPTCGRETASITVGLATSSDDEEQLNIHPSPLPPDSPPHQRTKNEILEAQYKKDVFPRKIPERGETGSDMRRRSQLTMPTSPRCTSCRNTGNRHSSKCHKNTRRS